MPKQHIRNALTICYWNANGLKSKLHELKHFVNDHNIDIMLINETHLKSSDSPNISQYILYNNNRPISKGGGTAIYIKHSIPHCELPTANTESMEISSIQVNLKSGPLNLHSVYYPPNATFYPNDVKKIFNTNTPTIIAGDLNAKHSEWNSIKTNTRGKELKKLADLNQIVIDGPSDPTHEHQSNPDVLDIVLLKNLSINYSLEVSYDLTSDHTPVFMYLGEQCDTGKKIQKTTDWKSYRDILNNIIIPIIKDENDLNNAVNYLENRIITSFESSTTMKEKPINYKTQIEQSTIDLIKERRRLRKLYHRTLYPNLKTEINKLSQQISNDIQAVHNQNWEEKLESLNTNDNSLWKMAKAIKKPKTNKQSALKHNNSIITNNKEKAELFADSMEQQFTPYNLSKKEEQSTQIKANNEPMRTPDKDTFVNPEEICQIIKNLKNRKAPGKDGITNQMLKNAPNKVIMFIVAIANATMRLNIFPNKWKTAKIIMVPKPNKPRTDPTSYRPISLLPTISKIIEKTIQTRLQDETEDLNILPDHQFGFRQFHAPVEQVIRVVENITENMNQQHKTGAVFLDLAKAFDKVWHTGLIYKMLKFGYTHKMVKLIQSYLRNRQFYIALHDADSTLRNIQAGVPQGSLLGPFLFNIYVSDMPNLPETQIGQFADDTVIYTSAIKPGTITNNLQRSINIIYEWFCQWKFQLNIEKTEAVYFWKNKKRKSMPKKQIQINKIKIPWTNEAKYLGVYLDSSLSFKKHTTDLVKKLSQKIGYLYPLLNRKSKLSLNNKILIYKSIIQPTATYGIQLWKLTSRKNFYKIQVKQNKVLRICTDAPFYISNKQLHHDLNVETFKELANKYTAKLYDKMKIHINPILKRIADQPLENSDQLRKRPKILLSD